MVYFNERDTQTQFPMTHGSSEDIHSSVSALRLIVYTIPLALINNISKYLERCIAQTIPLQPLTISINGI